MVLGNLLSVLATFLALPMAHDMPLTPGVKMSSAPYARNNIRHSMLIVSGMVSTQR